MDDVMISFAATGGSVGAHVDQYDVFLLQAHGHRRWQIDASESIKGKQPPLGFRPDVELKLLKVFKPTHDWVLAPGDMLYLPPNVPHHGVAEDPCLTFSFGMRAPSSAELISDYLDTLIADADENIRYQDADLKVPADPNEIDTVAMARVITALNAIRMNDPDKLGDWFGRFITTYRAAGEVMAHQAAPAAEEVVQALASGLLLQRHPWARLAWRRAKRGASLYVSGQDFALPVKDAQRLAGAEQLDAAAYRSLSDKGRAVVQRLLVGGVFQLIDPNELYDTEDEDDGEDSVVLGEVVEGRDRVDAIDDDAVSDDVHTVTVHDDGIEEQGIAAELERDALDPVSAHVLALDADDQPVGTGRLAPDGRIGRMAVLASHRSHGVGEALLLALVEAGRRLGLAELHLHAQLPARAFYARQGFLPEGDVFEEAGIGHKQKRRRLGAASAIDSRAEAVDITTAIVHRARRQLPPCAVSSPPATTSSCG
ncbi:hypothetical protein G6F22_011381 [Rhizopus arrhizus]|nr:hypothetical protein G6F22_011381 [Rhizopus arrhizus]